MGHMRTIFMVQNYVLAFSMLEWIEKPADWKSIVKNNSTQCELS